MVKFSVKYYLKTVAVSLLFYICGGFILSFFVTEEESVLSIAVPLIITIIGVLIRILILKRQINKSDVVCFETADYFTISLPAVCLLALTAIILVCEIYIDKTGNLMYQSTFDSVKSMIYVFFPGALTVDGIIYNLSRWNNTVYYILLVMNTAVYIFPTLIYIMSIRERLADNHQSGDD